MKKSEIISLSRELRQNQTPQEELLWANLRNRKLLGIKFLRQHPIIYSNTSDILLFFIADFYAVEKKLVIEIDGKIHDFQKEYDKNRDEILSALGLQVLRIKNEELKQTKLILNKIKTYL